MRIRPVVYWVRFGGSLAFGSELKALKTCPDWSRDLDRDAIASYMRHNYIPAPHTVYRCVKKLEPGCILTLKRDGEPVVTCTPSIKNDSGGRAGGGHPATIMMMTVAASGAFVFNYYLG